MSDQKIILITANSSLSAELARAFSGAGIQAAAVGSCAKFPLRDKPMYALALLDLDSLGSAKAAELKAFVAHVIGLPVIALCDIAHTSNRDTVDLLAAGANDVIAKNTDLKLLVAKIRAHLRRISNNDRAAGSWLK